MNKSKEEALVSLYAAIRALRRTKSFKPDLKPQIDEHISQIEKLIERLRK